MVACEVPSPLSRRKIFWTTQPDACGEYTSVCGGDCTIPGLQYIDSDTPVITGQGPARTFANTNWTRSLILNILNTKGRVVDPTCKVQVAAVNGHWSESYREDGLQSGTRIWAIGQQPVIRMSDAVALLNATLYADLNKLIKMGVASDIKIETTYKGSNKVSVSIIVYGPTADQDIIELTSERLANEWIWR